MNCSRQERQTPPSYYVGISEALLRHIATREGLPLERVPSSSLMKELFSLGILSRPELEVAQRAFSVRNALVHGFATTRA